MNWLLIFFIETVIHHAFVMESVPNRHRTEWRHNLLNFSWRCGSALWSGFWPAAAAHNNVWLLSRIKEHWTSTSGNNGICMQFGVHAQNISSQLMLHLDINVFSFMNNWHGSVSGTQSKISNSYCITSMFSSAKAFQKAAKFDQFNFIF